MIRVVLAEDDMLLREGLVAMLEKFGFDVVAAVGSAPALVAAVDAERPDMIVSDIRMPPNGHDDGLRAAVALRARHPKLAVVLLSQYVQAEYATALLGSGDDRGVGYLLKDRVADIGEFVETLRTIAGGGTSIDHEVIKHLVRQPRNPLSTLSGRELEVLTLLAEGRSNGSIATALKISEAAVGKHVGNVLAKLDLLPSNHTNRRVLAALTYLRTNPSA